MNISAYQKEIVLILSVFTRFAISFSVNNTLPREIIYIIIFKYIDIYYNSLPVFNFFDDTFYMLYNKKLFFLRHTDISPSFSKYCQELSPKDEKYLHPYRFLNSNMVKSFDIDNDIISISLSFSHCLIVVKDGFYHIKPSSSRYEATYPHCQKTYMNNIITTSCGYNYSMILTKNGLFATGKNNFGQLGLGDLNKRDSIELVKLSNVINVSSGDYFTFAISKEGLYSTGSNENGELGLGDYSDSTVFKRVNFENIILSIKCGSYFSLALTTDGLYGCGLNNDNQLGLFEHHYNTFNKIDISNLISYTCTPYDSFLCTNKGFFKNFKRYKYSCDSLYGEGYIKDDEILTLNQCYISLILTREELLCIHHGSCFDYAMDTPGYSNCKTILINTLTYKK